MRQLDLALLRSLAKLSAPEAPLPAGRGASFHSASVRPGDVFFALPGAHGHGMAFAEEALARGAAFVVSDLPHERGAVTEDPAGLLLALGRAARADLATPVVAVTGSAGKTSTKAMMAGTLAALATPGNLNTPLALAVTLLDAAMRADEARPLVLELGIDHVGEMARLIELTAPDHAVLTSVAASHLDALGDVATVAREKGALLAAAPGVRLAAWDARPHLPRELRAGVEAYRVLEPGEREPRDVPLLATRHPGAGFSQRLAFGALEVELPWPGRAMAHNALAALALAQRLGLDLGQAAGRLRAVRLEPGRLQPRRYGALTVLDDSYNSNPASAAAALEVLRGAPAPRAAVLGDMLELGPKSAAYHRALGEATRGLDLVLAVGPEAARIQEGNPEALHAADPAAAEALLDRLPRRGTVLFKASRGARLERLVEAFVRRLEPAAAPAHGGEAP